MEKEMRRPVTDEQKMAGAARRRTHEKRPIVLWATPREQARFRELAYRLVACTEPEEQELLKREIVRAVLTRARS
jgi:hypothetical protein